MSKEELHKEVVSNIRACLVSMQGRCDLRQLNRDYKLLMGTDIPYSKLGFKNLEEFICNTPSLTTSRSNGVLQVDAKEIEKSSHISTLVNSQKTRKRNRHSTNRPPRYSLASVRSKWQPKSTKTTYQKSPRPIAVQHNQFVNLPSSPPKQSTLSSRLASRLGPRVPLLKTNSLPLESQRKEDSSDHVFAKTKRRVLDKMKGIDMDDALHQTPSNSFSDDSVIHDNSFKYYEEAATPQSAPIAAVGNSFTWSNSLNSHNVDKDFITPFSPEQTKSAFIASGDHLEDLRTFAILHNLGDLQIKVMTRKAKSLKRTCYDCHIKIATHSYSSYPKDFYNERDARQEAARQALEELQPVYNRRKSLLISDEIDVLARIPPIVQSHYHGIWKEQLEADYTESFLEQLPSNWLEIVDALPNISVTPCLDKFVLRYCKPGEKGIDGSMQFVSNISVPSNSVIFDEDNPLNAEITCPLSASEIWCREINTPVAADFEKMAAELQKYCSISANLERVESVTVGSNYLAHDTMASIWCRVRVYNFTDDVANCFCIDFGNELVMKPQELYALPRRFARVQAQAFVCRLAGIEEFYETSECSEHINNLYGKIVDVHLNEKHSDDNFTHSVILVDAEDDTVINEQIQTSLESARYVSPDLKEFPMEVYLTHAENSGLVYLQVRYPGTKHLNSMISELETSIRNNEINTSTTPITHENSKSRLYLVECDETHSWRRTKILEWSPYQKDYAQIQYVDYGTTKVINVNKTTMYPLDELNKDLVKFTYQAKPARFALKEIPVDFANKIQRLIPEGRIVTVKVVGWESDDLPLIKIFMRSELDNLLLSINDAMDSENEIRDSELNGKSLSTKLQKIMFLNNDATAKTPSAGNLPPPPLPEVNQLIDVRIPCAVNPYNFFVQPHNSRKDLSKLMRQLQDRCNNVQYRPLSIADVGPGKVYASRFEDGQWYRTSVIKVINPGSISVFYCDFGYYANVTLQQLVPLDEHFLSLPYQAIKAKLAGIKPKHSKWSMDDCKFFQNLVCKKAFVAVLLGIEKDAYYRCDTVLNLKLVDTSTDNDIHVEQILISQDIAVAIAQ